MPPGPCSDGLFRPALSCLKADVSRFSAPDSSSAWSCGEPVLAPLPALPSIARFTTNFAAVSAAREVSISGIDDGADVPPVDGFAGAFFFVAAPPAADCSADAADLVVVADALVVVAAAFVVFAAPGGLDSLAAFFVSVACFLVAPASDASDFFAFAMVGTPGPDSSDRRG